MEKILDLKSTINLPKTDFPMKANLPQAEPLILDRWDKLGIYERIRQQRKNAPLFTLHDGPPYANGNIHLGHAENKILKDFIVKTRSMMGLNAPYIPGWDCHGLPIEIKVDQMLGGTKLNLSLVDIRRECRKYAEKFVNLQRQEFKRLGILGEWDQPYLTMSKQYEAAIARTFVGFVERGFVYKGLKPVHWCISCQTALAEAEVEYEDHTSPSVYVKFEVISDLAFINPELKGRKVFVIIWTTTPWTLPANLGIAFNAHLDYSAVEVGTEVYIMASELVEATAKATNFIPSSEIARFKGKLMEGLHGQHPFLNRKSLFILGDHVTLEQGTGAVHTAPGHGHEDYSVGKAYGLDIYCPVDGRGRFEEGTEFFAGMNVFDANAKVVELLKSKGALLATQEITHSYPHCWRCHNPVIFRATPQWFISMEHQNLRTRSLEAIKKVRWIPEWGEERISNMIANRPDWCISRQRVWGVPIIAFYCRNCKEPMLEKVVLENVVSLFELHGSDVWFEKDESELLPSGIRCLSCGETSFEKEGDILDVWFDSGSSHEAVLGKRWDVPWPADVYIEGGDQYRGWFHSSLLIGVGVRQGAPYRQVLTHGWTLDAEGKAMSKSLGNVIEPQSIVKDNGAEILRLWVAASDFKEDVRISKDMVVRLSEAYRKFRNTARFMLGNLFDFVPDVNSVESEALSEIDQWALLQTRDLLKRIYDWYKNYEFHRVYHAVNEFVTTDLSAFYFHILKDRLYTAATNSAARRSSQTAMHRILDAITRATAPIYSFTCDEIWQYLPKPTGSEESVHMSTFVPADQLISGFSSYVLQKLSRWSLLRELRASILRVLEVARKDKFIGDPLEAKVLMKAQGAAKGILSEYFDFLPYLLVVSQVELVDQLEPQKYFAEEGDLRIAVVLAEGTKCERCWNFSTKVGKDSTFPGVCDRCAAALREMGY